MKLLTYLRLKGTSCSPSLPQSHGGILPVMAYMGRLRPKGAPFSGFRCMKG